jgi:hypothetical protein
MCELARHGLAWSQQGRGMGTAWYVWISLNVPKTWPCSWKLGLLLTKLSSKNDGWSLDGDCWRAVSQPVLKFR